jgi:hypothetical protein
MGDEETTMTLSAVEAATEDDELERYLDGLAPGLGMLVVRHGPNAGSSYRLEAPVTTTTFSAILMSQSSPGWTKATCKATCSEIPATLSLYSASKEHL